MGPKNRQTNRYTAILSTKKSPDIVINQQAVDAIDDNQIWQISGGLICSTLNLTANDGKSNQMSLFTFALSLSTEGKNCRKHADRQENSGVLLALLVTYYIFPNTLNSHGYSTAS